LLQNFTTYLANFIHLKWPFLALKTDQNLNKNLGITTHKSAKKNCPKTTQFNSQIMTKSSGTTTNLKPEFSMVKLSKTCQNNVQPCVDFIAKIKHNIYFKLTSFGHFSYASKTHKFNAQKSNVK
jgi:hypothetical protein